MLISFFMIVLEDIYGKVPAMGAEMKSSGFILLL
jgi:hypothetical protein